MEESTARGSVFTGVYDQIENGSMCGNGVRPLLCFLWDIWISSLQPPLCLTSLYWGPAVFLPLNKRMLNALKKQISVGSNSALSHTYHRTELIQGQLMHSSQRDGEIWWFTDHQPSSRSYPLMRSSALWEAETCDHSGQINTWMHVCTHFGVQLTLPVDSPNVHCPLVRNPCSTR